MGRGPKTGVDYFSHDVRASIGPTLFTVQNSFGNDGYAFWFKLWEFVGTQEGLYADFSIQKDWLYFLSIARVDNEKGEKILALLADLDAIDKELWKNRRIVWSDNFQDRVSFVFAKRGLPVPQKPICTKQEVVIAEEQTKPIESEKTEKKQKTEPKKQYGEYVTMTETEYKSLVEKFGEQAALKCIETLDNYKGAKGQKYKSDYRAILNWVIDAVKEKHKEIIFKSVDVPTDGDVNPFDEFDD